MEALKNKIREQKTQMIFDCCITKFAGRDILACSREEQMVRSALLSVYGEREGTESLEALLDLMEAA